MGTVQHDDLTAPGLTWPKLDYFPSVLTLIGLDRSYLRQIGTNWGEIS